MGELEEAADALRGASSLVVLTGAGVSAESGVPTFRGKEGLWHKHRAEELATPEAFERDPKLVWEWYDWRRDLIGGCDPNPGHEAIARMESIFPEFTLVTQNIDGLHRRAGSTNILELHGNIWRMRCENEGTTTDEIRSPLETIPPTCESCGAVMRPDVVWFGESLDPRILDEAFRVSQNCGAMIVAGTSAVVQPAASLPLLAHSQGAAVVEVNLEQTPLSGSVDLSLFGTAGEILTRLCDEITR